MFGPIIVLFHVPVGQGFFAKVVVNISGPLICICMVSAFAAISEITFAANVVECRLEG